MTHPEQDSTGRFNVPPIPATPPDEVARELAMPPGRLDDVAARAMRFVQVTRPRDGDEEQADRIIADAERWTRNNLGGSFTDQRAPERTARETPGKTELVLQDALVRASMLTIALNSSVTWDGFTPTAPELALKVNQISEELPVAVEQTSPALEHLQALYRARELAQDKTSVRQIDQAIAEQEEQIAHDQTLPAPEITEPEEGPSRVANMGAAFTGARDARLVSPEPKPAIQKKYTAATQEQLDQMSREITRNEAALADFKANRPAGLSDENYNGTLANLQSAWVISTERYTRACAVGIEVYDKEEVSTEVLADVLRRMKQGSWDPRGFTRE